MKLYVPFILVIMCFCTTTAIAQKKKKNKKETVRSEKVDTVMSTEPPNLIQEEVKEVYDEKAVMPVEESAVIAYKSEEIYNVESPVRKVFGADGKYNLLSLKAKDYYGNYGNYRYGIEDSAGKNILPIAFSEIKDIGEGVRVKINDLSGLLDKSFNTLLPMEFESITPINGTKWLIIKNSAVGAKVVDKKGKQQVPGYFNSITELKEYNKPPADTTALLLFENMENKKAIYDCRQRHFLTPFNIVYANYNEAGIIARDDLGTHVFNKNMKPVNTEIYEDVQFTSQGMFIVTKNKKKGLLTREGNYILPCEYEIIDRFGSYNTPTIFIIKKGNQYKCIDYMGKNLLEDTYDLMQNSYESANNLLVKKGNKMGIKDILNHIVIPIEYDTIYTVSGKYITQKGTQFNVYSIMGDFINKLNCDKVEKLSYEYKVYYSNNKAGLMNNNFDQLTEPVYDKITYMGNFYRSYNSDYSADQFAVTQKGKVGIITKNEILTPIEYELILKLNSKVYLVKKNGKYGLLRSYDNKIMAPCQYDYISNENYSDIKYIGIAGNDVINITVN